MGWQSDGDEESDGSSVGKRLGALAQLVAAGAVLFGTVGFGWVEAAIDRLGPAASTVPAAPSIDPAVGLTLLGLSVGVSLVVAGLAIGAWYRLPDPPE